jgi:hypothetical protein
MSQVCLLSFFLWVFPLEPPRSPSFHPHSLVERFFARCIDKMVGCAMCFLAARLLRPQRAAVNFCHPQKSVPWLIIGVGVPSERLLAGKIP